MSGGALVIDGVNARLLEANAPARRLLGLTETVELPVALDAAMPALRYLRSIAELTSIPPKATLTFWSAGSVHHWRCQLERTSRYGSPKSHIQLRIVPAQDDGQTANRPAGMPMVGHELPNGAGASSGQVLPVEAVARLAHELRSPVAAILSAADVVAGGHLGAINDERLHSYIVGIRNSARHLLGVVETLMEQPARAIGSPSANFSRIDISATVREVAHGLRASADRAGVALVTDLSAALPSIVADPTELRQMVYNLLSNGIRHAGVGATVIARTGRDVRAKLWLEVEDDGPGIPQAVIDRIIGQGDAAMDADARLGLLLTRELAEANAADLSLLADVAGTRARITFPVRKAKRGQAGITRHS